MLVIQADVLTQVDTPMIVVLPMTTRIASGLRHWRITVPARERLLKDCQIVIDQPRALDRRRLGTGPLTRLTNEEISRVEKSLKAVLGMI